MIGTIGDPISQPYSYGEALHHLKRSTLLGPGVLIKLTNYLLDEYMYSETSL